MTLTPGQSPPKLVVFDFASIVLGHSEGMLSALVAAMRAHGLSVEPEVASVAMGYPAAVGIERLVSWLRPQASAGGELQESIFYTFLKEHQRFCRFSNQPELAPGLDQTITTLRKSGCRIALGTNMEAACVQILSDRLGWGQEPPFDVWLSGDEVDDVRPGPGMIHQLMAAAEVKNPQDVVKVGDTPVDIEEGRNAGCGHVMLLDNGWLDAMAISACRPDAILEYVDDLLAYLPLTRHHSVDS